MKTIVKVFPDYCSSGVWLDGYNCDPDELEVSPALQLALKYWHEAWEFIIAEDTDDFGDDHPIMKKKMTDAYVARWHEDGRKLVEMMSAENDKYEFVYVK